ncbi:MAG: hypothetical protein JO041_07080 [Acidobacteria bacterium]|nr:hypothetical protein [Acidobacteriota bacterium]
MRVGFARYCRLPAAVIAAAGLASLAAGQKTGKPPASSLDLGIVVFQQVPAGQETSGSIVPDPESYTAIPALRVIPLELPLPPHAKDAPGGTSDNAEQAATAAVSSPVHPSTKAPLERLVVDTGDGRKQSGAQPLTWVPAANQAINEIVAFLRDDPARKLAMAGVPVKSDLVPAGLSHHAGVGAEPTACSMPSVAVPGGVEVIHGDTSGNSSRMTVALDGSPAQIVAARPGTVFWRIPGTVQPGPHEVVFAPGPGRPPVRLPLSILALSMNADRRELVKGERTRMTLTVSGLEAMPESAWQSELPPADLMDVHRWELETGVHAPSPVGAGTVVVVLENRSAQAIRMGNGKKVVLMLHHEDFAHGPYIYRDQLQSLSSGGFDIRATATAFLKQSIGRPQ